MPVRLSSWLELIDTCQFGRPKIGAAYLLHGDRCALIDTGTPRALTQVMEELGSTLPEVILLTHVHLDHAGGAPGLARANPGATVYVHERGVRHLVDPTRLNASVRAATGPLADLYGEMDALPPKRIQALRDGDQIDLGQGIVIEAIDTPGHAPHHLCFFEPTHRALFCGDAVGTRHLGEHVPATVPPSFDLEVSCTSLNRLKTYRPETLYFPHFGAVDQAIAVLDRYEKLLRDWVEAIRGRRTRNGDNATVPDDAVVNEILSLPQFRALKEPFCWEVAMCVRGVLQYLDRDEE